MLDKLAITRNWLPRYTGMPLDSFGDYILLTNFYNYLESFAEQFDCDIHGIGRPMQAASLDTLQQKTDRAITVVRTLGEGPAVDQRQFKRTHRRQ